MQNCFRKYPEIYGAELEDESSEQDGEEVVTENTEKTSTASEQPIVTNPEVSSHSVDTNGISSLKVNVDDQKNVIAHIGKNEPNAKSQNK